MLKFMGKCSRMILGTASFQWSGKCKYMQRQKKTSDTVLKVRTGEKMLTFWIMRFLVMDFFELCV